MLYEYALEPALLNNWKDFRYFTEKFGVSRGRMIARYPKRWKRLVYESLANCGEIERKRIEEGLSRLDDRLLARHCEWNPQLDWLANAEAEHLHRPFHAILAKTNPNQRDFALEGDSVDGTHPLWNVGITRVISRTAREMEACVALLLRLSKEIMFIDPYFRPQALRHRRPLEAFLSAVLEKRADLPPTHIELHTGNSLRYDYFKAECEQRLPSVVPEGIQVHIVRWREKDGGEKLHNRYILTDIGGVSFGVGLDDGADGETDEVTLLEDKTYRFRWAQYMSPEPAFELVDELMVEVNGSYSRCDTTKLVGLALVRFLLRPTRSREEKAFMPRQFHPTLELPDEAAKYVPAKELAEKAKEALAMELFREHEVSQTKAAELLGISRYDPFELMSKYCIPVIDLTPGELEVELKNPFPRSHSDVGCMSSL